mmetsp:Transcript_1758/g.3772  ORF Transcript_1758/g.3772 Transcript_1758/m.3772 type:complete len:218 (-) Transcript_1758:105-758(-)|eukprot:CAMPEP_0172310404 /NCGR_PEP_ID=MMETSP1058-20130122/11465_1 /TAXON_ID=83371 /ORGANISM="Detonula confervacea, Strain CCMP 353" /LENGTH=217 /DNA_ID=CAMNT_0013023205 /DNA_START=22 /DNA_END=675 /DNA_ORIENTATION=+
MKSTTAVILSAAIGSTIGFAPVQTTSRTPTSLAFFGNAKKSSVKSSPLADEAIEIYNAKYTGGVRQKFFFSSWGMPESYTAPETTKSLFSRDNTELISAFNVIASLYGEEDALKMVKIEPGVLAFNKDNFGPSLEAFGEKFGLEESKAMIVRNPGLLSVKPASAEAADDLTMQLSYVVDVTRPIGKAGPFIILALLSVPALEGATGVSRGELFGSLF